MRWDALFSDLEAQLEQAEALDEAAELAGRARAERSEPVLADRLRALVGAPVRLTLPSGTDRSVLVGALLRVGSDHLLLQEAGGREALVPLARVLQVAGPPGVRAQVVPATGLAARLGLGTALRALARDRAPVLLGLVDGTSSRGTLDRAGRDFLELAAHPGSELRRRDVGHLLVPLAAVASVRSA